MDLDANLVRKISAYRIAWKNSLSGSMDTSQHKASFVMLSHTALYFYSKLFKKKTFYGRRSNGAKQLSREEGHRIHISSQKGNNSVMQNRTKNGCAKSHT